MIKFHKQDDHANFALTFPNGHTVSIAAGKGTMSSGNFKDGFISVEVGAWDSGEKWISLSEYNDVKGWVSAEEVLELFNRVASLPSNERSTEMVSEIEDTLTRIRMISMDEAKEMAVRNGLVSDGMPTQSGREFLAAFSDQPGTRSVFR